MQIGASRSRVDWSLILAAAGLLLLGTLAVTTAASDMPYYNQILQRHFLAMFVGLGLFLFGLGLNYQIFQDQSKVIYLMVLALMVGVLFFGTVKRGHRSWFDLPFFSFQPVEVARLGVILVLAGYLDHRSRKIGEISTVAGALALTGAVMGLVLKQPDFASTITFFPILLGMLFGAGASPAHLMALVGFGGVAISFPILYTLLQIHFPGAAPGSLTHSFMELPKMGLVTAAAVGVIVAGAGAAWRMSVMMRVRARLIYFIAVPLVLIAGLLSGIVVNRQLKGYQRNRFVAFLAPETDIQGASYNVNQSVIAIGSGGLWGKGLFSGTQSRLGFLPERHTDFAYAVVGEELGFLGAMSILGLYMLLLWRLIMTAKISRDRYGSLVCAGLASMFAFNLVLNVGMCLGIVPVAGIPLPLISYGGSSLAITLWGLGIASNIFSRRYSFA